MLRSVMLCALGVVIGAPAALAASDPLDARVEQLLARMTLAEKLGQMSQMNAGEGKIPAELRQAIKDGRVGSLLNEVHVETVNELQRIVVQESRLGIPLLMGRDVIHGFKTILPIPLGQAASWNPALVQRGAHVAALEAASTGVNWTFAPMVDIARDPRWGRIAESFGEDPYLTSAFAVASVRGFQGDDLAARGSIAACAKHFAGYGASESGRDYNFAGIPEIELRNVHLPPFKAAVDAGVATLMASFSDLNGVPASGNRFLMTTVLRDEWRFNGFVLSDWESIAQLKTHGFAADDKAAAFEAANAGIGMEMVSTTFRDRLPLLIAEGRISVRQVDAAVRQILRLKSSLGLFERPYTDPASYPAVGNQQHLLVARQLAVQSLVLLQNRRDVLPLKKSSLRSLAVIGPLADDGYEQLGTWIFDADQKLSQTPLRAIGDAVGDRVKLRYVRAMETSRSRTTNEFGAALAAARSSDAVIVFLGEESILSGEAHSRADINLPGNQMQLLQVLRRAGKPLIVVILAGRPLTLAGIVDEVDAILYAWHPGSMGGPAIADVLFGVESPSGKLPVTFPRMVGQVPIYYASRNTGKPAGPNAYTPMDEIKVRSRQTDTGLGSHHLDAGYTPLFPFGYGLSYSKFSYADIAVSSLRVRPGEVVVVSATVKNVGALEAEEVAQLYVRDRVGSVTRPQRELKSFQRLRLRPGESRKVSFDIAPADLAFYGRDLRLATEPGDFDVWIGGSSTAELQAEFTILGQ